MNKQLDSKETKTKPELYTVLCPVGLFRYFIRKQYEGVEMSNEDIDEIGIEFAKYLTELNLTDKQKKNILPKDTFDVILNDKHPFRMNGFPAGYVLHFTRFIEESQKSTSVK